MVGLYRSTGLSAHYRCRGDPSRFTAGKPSQFAGASSEFAIDGFFCSGPYVFFDQSFFSPAPTLWPGPAPA